MPSKARVWAAALLLAAVVQGAAAPAPPESTNSTTITSKKGSFDYRNHYAVFEGDVVVIDPSVKIESDKLTIVFEKDNSPKVAIAVGNVRIQQADKKAVCERAVYQVPLGRLDLAGNPVVRRGKDLMKGRLITFWRDQDKMDGEDVQLMIYMKGDEGFKDFLKEK